MLLSKAVWCCLEEHWLSDAFKDILYEESFKNDKFRYQPGIINLDINRE